MAKSDLLGGSLWQNYSQKVAERMDHPTYLGTISEEEAAAMNADLIIADHGAESCGDAVRLYWAVERESDKILDARFKSFGCGTAIASSDMMAELCIGKTVDQAIEITNLDVEKALRDSDDIPAVPPQKMHCSVMAYDVIKSAAATYKGIDVRALEESTMVCECARVTLSTIEEVIRINDLKTVEEISDYTKAGAFCKSCVQPGGHEKRKWYLVDILSETRAKMELESAEKENIEFTELNSFKQFKALEKVLDAEVRPSLHQDGGDVDVEDFFMDGEIPIVSISYSGACLGCISSNIGTLDFIEEILKKRLHPDIQVKII